MGEVVDRGLHPTVRQLVNAAGRIGGDVSLCLAVDSSFEAAVLDGVDVGNVILLEHPDAAADGVGGVYSLTTELVSAAVERLSPSVVLVGKTDAGSVVSARLAARFGAGLASDCIDLAVNAEGRVAVTRPVHGGNALAVYEFQGDGLQVVSVRPGAFEAVEGVSGMPEVSALRCRQLRCRVRFRFWLRLCWRKVRGFRWSRRMLWFRAVEDLVVRSLLTSCGSCAGC